MTGDDLWHREAVRHHYQLPAAPRDPLLCVDARPGCLSEEGGARLPRSPGKAKRYHSAYTKKGSCCVVLAFAPQSGFRSAEVRERRPAEDYAEFRKHFLALHSPPVEALRRVPDTLNPHTPGAFSEGLPPAEAFALAQRLEPHDTPKKGAGLNLAEIQFAALSKPCLNRRLPDLPSLRPEVRAWADQRNQEGKTVHWKFSQDKARQKLQRHYTRVLPI
jgi:hypothetical protein